MTAPLAQPPLPDLSTPDLTEKFRRVFDRIRALDRVIVAWSGGVDSTLVLKIGTLALGPDCIAVTAQSETLTDDEFDFTVRLADEHDFHQQVIAYSELDIPNYAENPANRCYFCKHELYTRLRSLAERLAARAILDGSNADDVGDYRPGLQAVRELEVVSVLREADLHKEEIRAMARELGLENWSKPAGACLSSRIPYGEKIDRTKLDQVARGEAFLRSLGFDHVRLRHHGPVARIEVPAAEIPRLAEPDLRDRIDAQLRSLGFRFVTLDLAGYRTGSLNSLLPSQPTK